MSPRFLHYIEDEQQAQDLKGRTIDSVWFEDNGVMVILLDDSTDVAIGMVNGEMVIERREWSE